jgi:hypothetical protein
MVIIDQLFQVTDPHGTASHVIDSAPLISVAIHHIQVTSAARILRSLSLGLAHTLHILDVLLF